MDKEDIVRFAAKVQLLAKGLRDIGPVPDGMDLEYMDTLEALKGLCAHANALAEEGR